MGVEESGGDFRHGRFSPFGPPGPVSGPGSPEIEPTARNQYRRWGRELQRPDMGPVPPAPFTPAPFRRSIVQGDLGDLGATASADVAGPGVSENSLRKSKPNPES